MKSSGSFPQLLITEREVKLPNATLYHKIIDLLVVHYQNLLLLKLPLLLSQAKQRSLGRPFATDTTAEEQQQEITR